MVFSIHTKFFLATEATFGLLIDVETPYSVNNKDFFLEICMIIGDFNWVYVMCDKNV